MSEGESSVKRHALTTSVAFLLAAGSGDAVRAAGPSPAPPQPPTAETAAAAHRAVLDRYCVTCHSARIVRGEPGGASPLVAQLRAAGLMLDTLDPDAVDGRAEVWERVVRKLRAGMMPPAGRPRPEAGELEDLAGWLERQLDAAARARPDPGRPAAVHRLNRAEYRNVVRDLLAVEVAVADLLPADDSSHGFDNIGVALRLSESLLERYLAAARRVSRIAVGRPPPGVASDTYRIATDQPQHDRVATLPFGTRGGTRITHLFPRDADYEIAVELGRVRGDRTAHRLEVTVDGERVALVTVGQPVADGERGVYHEGGELIVRTPVAAGPRDVGVTFHRRSQALVEQVRDPFRNPRRGGVAANAATPLPSLDQPTGVPDGYGEHLTLLYDLLALAYQADATRVSCTQIAREQSGRTYPDIGVPEGHHTISHHQMDAHNVAQYTKVNVYHLSLFARFVEKLRATPDGDGTLLDHAMLLYGCGMGDGDHHTPFDLPVALVGGGAGRLAGNRHLKYPLHTPFMNLGLSLLEKLDVHVDRIADSTGRLAGL